MGIAGGATNTTATEISSRQTDLSLTSAVAAPANNSTTPPICFSPFSPSVSMSVAFIVPLFSLITPLASVNLETLPSMALRLSTPSILIGCFPALQSTLILKQSTVFSRQYEKTTIFTKNQGPAVSGQLSNDVPMTPDPSFHRTCAKKPRRPMNSDVRRQMARGPDGSMLCAMKIANGRVVGGKRVVEGVTLEEGSSVTVLAREDAADVTLSPEEEAEILLAIAEADRGETVSAEEVLERLARRHG